jgi:hypothetical protein
VLSHRGHFWRRAASSVGSGTKAGPQFEPLSDSQGKRFFGGVSFLNLLGLPPKQFL